MKKSKVFLPITAFVFAFGAAFFSIQQNDANAAILATRTFYIPADCSTVSCDTNGQGLPCDSYRANISQGVCSGTVTGYFLP